MKERRLATVCVLAGLACGAPGPAESPALPDSLVHDAVVYRGRLAVEPRNGTSYLDVRVELRSLRSDSTIVESETGNCNPPLYLRRASGGRWIAWSDLAWEASDDGTVTCVGTGLLVRLTPGARGALARRTYPVRAILGDSLRSGWYDVVIGAVILDTMRTRRAGLVVRVDTIRVPAGRVRLTRD